MYLRDWQDALQLVWTTCWHRWHVNVGIHSFTTRGYEQRVYPAICGASEQRTCNWAIGHMGYCFEGAYRCVQAASCGAHTPDLTTLFDFFFSARRNWESHQCIRGSRSLRAQFGSPGCPPVPPWGLNCAV